MGRVHLIRLDCWSFTEPLLQFSSYFLNHRVWIDTWQVRKEVPEKADSQDRYEHCIDSRLKDNIKQLSLDTQYHV